MTKNKFLAKIYRTAAFVVSVLERRIGGIKRRRADLQAMMLAMCMRSSIGFVGCTSALYLLSWL
jgi:hypothetical protein